MTGLTIPVPRPAAEAGLEERASFPALAHESVVREDLACRTCLVPPEEIALTDSDEGCFALFRCPTCGTRTVLTLDPWQLMRLHGDAPTGVVCRGPQRTAR